MTFTIVATSVLVGPIAGWLAGLNGDMILGLVGSLLGSWIFRAVGISDEAGIAVFVVVAFVSAAIVIVVQRTLWETARLGTRATPRTAGHREASAEAEGSAMAEDRKAIVGSVASAITRMEDTDEGVNAAARETTQPDKARSQVLWMVDQARRAAKDGRADDARSWSDGAARALWNMN